MITGARTEPFDDRDDLLVVDAQGHPAIVIMEPDDARAIVDALVDHSAVEASTVQQEAPIETVAGISIPSPAEGSTQPPAFVEPGAARRADRRIGFVPLAGGAPVDPSGGDPITAAIRSAFIEGDWQAGADAFDGLHSPRAREHVVRHLGGEALADGLDAWVSERPESASAYLARGANAVWTAFTNRKPSDPEAFWEQLRHAELDLFWALELDFDDPVVFTPLVRSGSGLEIPVEELCMRFDESGRRGERLLGIHIETLIALGPLGIGSDAEMRAFAIASTQDAGEGSPLHALRALAELASFDTEERDVRRSRTFSSEAIRDVELARAMSVDSAAWSPGVEADEVMNIFAAAAMRCGDAEGARRYMTTVGSRRTFDPWSLLSDGEDLYRSVVAAAD
ncbi:MAG: hypothetical protein JST73_04690 [Actinobacteria bacterium]|nr:hypothetical protein [Actinomycetota bacterium]